MRTKTKRVECKYRRGTVGHFIFLRNRIERLRRLADEAPEYRRASYEKEIGRIAQSLKDYCP